MITKRHLCALSLAVASTACATMQPRAPEPIIRTVEVQVPFDDPACARAAVSELGAAPAYPDTETALRDAPNLFERVKLLLAGRKMRMVRELSLNMALEDCAQ